VIGKLADIDEEHINNSVQCVTPRGSVCGAMMHQDEYFERSSFILLHYFSYKMSKELFIKALLCWQTIRVMSRTTLGAFTLFLCMLLTSVKGKSNPITGLDRP